MIIKPSDTSPIPIYLVTSGQSSNFYTMNLFITCSLYSLITNLYQKSFPKLGARGGWGRSTLLVGMLFLCFYFCGPKTRFVTWNCAYPKLINFNLTFVTIIRLSVYRHSILKLFIAQPIKVNLYYYKESRDTTCTSYIL